MSLFVERLCVAGRRRVEDVHLLCGRHRVDGAYKEVQIGEPLLCRLKVKVHAHGDDGVIGGVVVRLLSYELHKIACPPQHILIIERLIEAVDVEAEASRWPVDVGQDAGEEVAPVADARTGLPNVLQRLHALSQILVLVVYPTEKEGVETHLCKERRLFT